MAGYVSITSSRFISNSLYHHYEAATSLNCAVAEQSPPSPKKEIPANNPSHTASSTARTAFLNTSACSKLVPSSTSVNGTKYVSNPSFRPRPNFPRTRGEEKDDRANEGQ